MVYAESFCSLSEVQAKAGAQASATSKAAAYVTAYMRQVEATINVMTRKNWTDWLATTPNEDVRVILADCASNLCAIYVINYDLSGFPSTDDAETVLDVLYNGFIRDIEVLKEITARDFMIGA